MRSYPIVTTRCIFRAFSQQRLVGSIGDSRTDFRFFVPGSNGDSAATTRAFGVILVDVDQPDGSGRGYALVRQLDGRYISMRQTRWRGGKPIYALAGVS